MYCIKCGTENEDNNVFCKNCGAKLVTNNTGSQSVASNSGVAHAHNSTKIKMIAGVAVIVILVVCSLKFVGTKTGEEDFISVGGSSNELTYAISDSAIDPASSAVDMFASSKDDTGAAVAEQEITGEAGFSSTSDVSTIAGAKLLKEQTRAQRKESLLEIIQNDELTEEAKREAVNSMIVLTETAQKESDAQMLLEAKGFTNTMVSISGDSADVMIETASLTEAQTAQIIDIVQRKTDIAPENIIITVLGVE